MAEAAEKVAEFVDRFNRREYRKALVPVEDLWLAGGNDFYKGLIRLVVALHQLDSTDLIESPRFLLGTAESLLAPFVPQHLGMDVAGLLGFIARCREFVEERAMADPGGPAPPPEYTIEVHAVAAPADPAPTEGLPWYRRLFGRRGFRQP